MANNYYKAKVWNAFCDSCGFKFKSDQLKLRWDGLMVDDACWEPRQPQDFLRAIKETSNILPWTRPQDGSDGEATQSPLYVENNYWDDPGTSDSGPNGGTGIEIFYVGPGSSPPAVIPPGYTLPTISVQPANQSVTEGDSATFSVTATGVATPWYQWKVNGVAIPGATLATYTIAATTLSQNGEIYTVDVINTAGTVTSSSATLTVAAAASTWSSTYKEAAIVLSGGDYIATLNGVPGAVLGVRGRTVGASANTYQFEIHTNGINAGRVAIGQISLLLGVVPGEATSLAYAYSGDGAIIKYDGTILDYITGFSTGDYIQVTFSESTGNVSFYKAGVLQATVAGLTGTWYPCFGDNLPSVAELNTGQSAFQHAIGGAIAWG